MATLTPEWQKIAEGGIQYFGNTPGQLILFAKYISQDIANNTTTYQIDMHLNVWSSYIGNYQSTPYNIQGTGTPARKDADQGSKAYSSGYIDSFVTTVEHNDDGTKSINLGGEMNFTAWGIILTAYERADLPTIPKTSSVTATNANIGSNTTINITRASDSFTHTLLYSFGNASGTIVTKTSNTTYNWTVPTSFYYQIPNAKSGTCTITCQTYSGDTLIGSKTTTFVASVSAANAPTISGSVIDNNATAIALTGDNKKLIKNISTAKITYTTSAKNGAYITNTTINDIAVSSSPYLIENVTTNTFILKTVDSRGYSNVSTLNPTMINYIPLSINVNFYRPTPTTGQVALTFNGNYFNGSFGEQSNNLQLKWYYKIKNNSNWILGGTLVENTDYVISGNTFYSGNSTSQSAIIIGNNFDYKNAYDFKIQYNDKIIDNEITKSITKGQPAFFWNNRMVKIFEDLYLKNDVSVDDLLNGLIPRIDQQALSNWDNLYNKLGIYIYLVYDYFDNLGAPNGAYLYGLLIVVCGNLNPDQYNQFNNLQIYIPDGVEEAGTRDMNRIFIRNGTGAWLGINGIKITKKIS